MQAEFLRLQRILKKTIVFITHDFEEAIAARRPHRHHEGRRIIQLGTPEDLVLHPATGYVAEFTRDVQRSKVMSAGRVMRPVSNGAHYTRSVKAGDKVASFAADIVEAKASFAVLGTDGSIVGEVTPDRVIDLLAGREPAKTP